MCFILGNNGRKGISPLIASVLLIAFTMAVAGLAGPFFTDLIQQQTSQTDDKVKDVKGAANSGLELEQVKYNDSSGNYTVTFQNTGETELENITLTTTGDENVQKRVKKSIDSKKIETVTLDTSSSSNQTELSVNAENTPVSAETDLTEDDNTETVSSTDDGGDGGGSSTETVSWASSTDWDNAISESGVVHASFGNHSSTTVEIGYKSSDQGGSNLAAYWPLDGSSASDVSGNNYDGSNNAQAGKTGVLGTEGYGFDGSNDYIDLTNHMSSLATSSFTVCSWVKPNTFSNEHGIFQVDFDWNSGEKSGWSVHIRSGKYKVKMPYAGSGGTSSGTSTDTWHHVCGSYGSSGNVRLYVDGNREVNTGSSTSYDTDDFTTIGSWAPNGEGDTKSTNSFDGEMDETRIYDRELSGSEVSDLYDRASGSNNTMVTDWKTYSSDRDVSSLNLKNVNASLNSQDVWVKVQSDTSDDGNVDESSSVIGLDGSGGSYSVSGLSTDNEKFRLKIKLSTSDVTKTPVVDDLALEG